MRRVGIVGCSNGQPESQRTKLSRLECVLRSAGFEPVWSRCIYSGADGLHSGTPRERAQALMELYRDASIETIFDISGGDLANEILPWLDFERIASSGKRLWGYSDLTCVLNAIYARTGVPSVLYQVRNLIREEGERQMQDFCDAMAGGDQLFHIPCRFYQGDFMEGVVLGGNIRCLLKLAGTPYWPDLSGKILFFEALSGDMARITAHIAQLEQLGAFRNAAGVLLGTFTELESQTGRTDAAVHLMQNTGLQIPLAATRRVGHGPDSKAVWIGGRMTVDGRGGEPFACSHIDG